MKRGYGVYVSGEDPPGDDAALLHRAALQVLRPVLDRAEIDPFVESAETRAVERLYLMADEQGQLVRRHWWSVLSGVELNPRLDEHFDLMLALSADALLLDAYDRAGRNVFSANDNGHLYLELTREQHDELTWRLVEAELPPYVLVFRKWKR